MSFVGIYRTCEQAVSIPQVVAGSMTGHLHRLDTFVSLSDVPLAIPLIPGAFLWQGKLAGDLVGPLRGASALIPSTIPLLYLPPLILACLIVAGTRLARRRSAGRAHQRGSRSTSPRGAVRV